MKRKLHLPYVQKKKSDCKYKSEADLDLSNFKTLIKTCF